MAHGDFYLIPLAKVGEVPQRLDDGSDKWVDGDQTPTLICDGPPQTEKPRLIAAGYETTRSQSDTGSFGQSLTWEERLLVSRSEGDAIRQTLMDKRLKEATEELLALTPPVGRGRRQIRKRNPAHQKGRSSPATPGGQSNPNLHLPTGRDHSDSVRRPRTWRRQSPPTDHHHCALSDDPSAAG